MKVNEFDKWWEENYMNVSANKTEAEDIYNLGVESQQAKIDLLEVQLKGAEERAKLILDHKNKMVDELQEQLRIEREQGTDYFTDFHSVIAERDELQARIDASLKKIDIFYMTNGMSDLTHEEIYGILRGNKDGKI